MGIDWMPILASTNCGIGKRSWNLENLFSEFLPPYHHVTIKYPLLSSVEIGTCDRTGLIPGSVADISYPMSTAPTINQVSLGTYGFEYLCSGSIVVIALDCGPGGSWFKSEWVPTFYEARWTAQGSPDPSVHQGSTLGTSPVDHQHRDWVWIQ